MEAGVALRSDDEDEEDSDDMDDDSAMLMAVPCSPALAGKQKARTRCTDAAHTATSVQAEKKMNTVGAWVLPRIEYTPVSDSDDEEDDAISAKYLSLPY